VTHYSLEAWADFVRGLLDDGERQRMRDHAQGCARCGDDQRRMAEVADTLSWDSKVQPRPEIVRRAHALAARLPAPRPGFLRRLVAALVVDTGTQPALAGVRSGGRGVRQMVFNAERYQVHVQWEHAAPGGPVSLVGRVAATTEATLPPGIVVQAVTPTTIAGETTTNKFGEFVLECPWDPALALHLPVVSDGVRIEVPLGSASEPASRPRPRRRGPNEY
jgi:Putative zinc-finger